MSDRKHITRAVVQALYTKSGNQCSFPGCTHELVVGDLSVAQICHISAASPLGPRFDPNQTDDDRYSESNLMMMCYKHHRIVDRDLNAYPKERLQKMKTAHESLIGRTPYFAPQSVIDDDADRLQAFWDRIKAIWYEREKDGADLPEFIDEQNPVKLIHMAFEGLTGMEAVSSDLNRKISQLEYDVEQKLKSLGYSLKRWQAQPYEENPVFYGQFFDLISIGIPNWTDSVRYPLLSLEVRVLELLCSQDPNNEEHRLNLADARTKLKDFSSSIDVVD